MTQARIAVVDDHAIIAQSLAASLTALGHRVVWVEPEEHEDLLAEVLAERPEVVLLDLDLAGAGDGARLVEPLTEAGARVLVLTGVQDRARRARCLRAGAVAVLGKDCSFDELRRAIQVVVDDGELLSAHEREEELAWLREVEAARTAARDGFDRLTPRESEVLGDLMEGRPVDEIASRAVVAESTVRSQVRSILRKLGVQSQLAAVARAREAGWEPPAG